MIRTFLKAYDGYLVMKSKSLGLLVACMLFAGNAHADRLPEALVDFVRVCAQPRLEGTAPDLAILKKRFKKAAVPADRPAAASAIKSYYVSRSKGQDYSLAIHENGHCVMRYGVSSDSPFGSEFVLALRELKKKHYRGQIGPPALPGQTYGSTAIWMKNDVVSFDVGYQYREKDGIRSVVVSTNE